MMMITKELIALIYVQLKLRIFATGTHAGKTQFASPVKEASLFVNASNPLKETLGSAVN